MNISINITGLDLLAQAINNLANALQGKSTPNPSVPTPVSTPAQTQGVAPTPQQPPLQTQVTASTPPQTHPMQVMPQPPTVVSAPVISQPIPTTSVSYTLEDLSNAGVSLMDKGMQSELMRLVNSFGVNSLVELPKERYGEFAIALRGLGAAI